MGIISLTSAKQSGILNTIMDECALIDWFQQKMEEFRGDPEFQAELFILIVEESGTEGREDG